MSGSEDVGNFVFLFSKIDWVKWCRQLLPDWLKCYTVIAQFTCYTVDLQFSVCILSEQNKCNITLD